MPTHPDEPSFAREPVDDPDQEGSQDGLADLDGLDLNSEEEDFDTDEDDAEEINPDDFESEADCLEALAKEAKRTNILAIVGENVDHAKKRAAFKEMIRLTYVNIEHLWNYGVTPQEQSDCARRTAVYIQVNQDDNAFGQEESLLVLEFKLKSPGLSLSKSAYRAAVRRYIGIISGNIPVFNALAQRCRLGIATAKVTAVQPDLMRVAV